MKPDVKGLKVAIVGAGSMAKEHCKVFQSLPTSKVVAICSRTEHKAQRLASEFGVKSTYSDIDQMFEAEEPDLTVIAVNITSTLSVCRKAFKYPSSFLIEKPLGLNIAEAKLLLEEAEKHGTEAFVALNRRYIGSSLFMRQQISKIHGNLFLRICDQEDLISAAKDGFDDLVLKNWSYANSIHLIDLLLYYARSPIKKIDIPRPYLYDRERFSTHQALIDYENGDQAIYECVWNAQGPWAVIATGQERRLEQRPIEACFYQGFPSREKFEYSTSAHDQNFKPGFYLQGADFVNSRLKEKHNLVSLKEAMATMELVNRIYF